MVLPSFGCFLSSLNLAKHLYCAQLLRFEAMQTSGAFPSNKSSAIEDENLSSEVYDALLGSSSGAGIFDSETSLLAEMS